MQNKINIRLPHNGWKPRNYQKEFWHYWMDGGRYAALAWHRRSGKDEVALHGTCIKAVKRPASYWHLLPQEKQGRTAMWDAVNARTGKLRIDDAFPRAFRRVNKKDLLITFANGSNWSVKGSDNHDKLVGAGVAGLIFSEYALANPMSSSMLQPMIKENQGYEVYISTPRGKNHFKGVCDYAKADKNAFYQKLTVEDTGIFSQQALDDIYKQLVATYNDEDIADAIFQQEYYCSFDAAILGAIYARLLDRAEADGRVSDTKTLFDPKYPVQTAWDIGFSDALGIWFYQVIGQHIVFINYFEKSGMTPEETVQKLLEIAIEKGYRYAEPHHLPHDGMHKLYAAGGRSVVEQLFSLGVKTAGIPSTTKVNTLSAGRKTISRAFFGKDTKEARELLRSYRYEWDDKNKKLKSTPLHDYTSHCADALGIASRVWTGDTINVTQKQPKTIMDILSHSQNKGLL